VAVSIGSLIAWRYIFLATIELNRSVVEDAASP
jgi:hypothetical protein